jgi:hypothetical protein
MENRAKYILTATFTLLLISSASATLEDFTIDWEEDWEQFENTLNNCESSNCITDDSLGNVEQGLIDLKIDTGDTGFCGTGGVKKDIVIPSGDNIGLAISLQKAQLDNWGGRVGVKANDEWLLTFSSEGGQSKTIDHTDDVLLGDESTYYADVSKYAGEEVTLKIATNDRSQEWCNMGDHEQSMNVNALFIVSEIQDEEFTSNGEDVWDKYQVNTVNCESQYNCDSDEKQPLDTNEISSGQLVLNSGMGSSDGHCGTYGREQWVYVPKAENVELNFEASAELDEWGGNLGVMFDDDWVFTFNDSGGEGRTSYEMQERTRDVSEYSGEYVKLRVAYQDTSGSYCSMYDHDRKMTVESIEFETSGNQGDSANRPPSASLNAQRFAGTTISFSASESSDPDNGKGDLQTRWDWQNDGSWDTDWQNILQRDYTYPESTSEATAKVKVRDGDGGSDTATATVSFGNSGDDGSDDEQPSGDTQDIEIEDNGWKVVHLTEEVDRSKFSGCNGNSGATAYHADSGTGYLQRADLSESGTLSAGKYFIQSTSSTACTVEEVKVSSAPSTGEVEIPDNGWKTVKLGEGTDKSKFSGCNGDESATAYHSDSDTGYLQRADLSESGTLSAGKYFIQSTSTSACTVSLGGSSDDGDTGGDDGDTGGDDGESYASTEDEWCQTNGNGEALSSFRDDVESGCKPVNDLDYEAPSGGSNYYASENDGISCASGDEAYICEE